MPLTTRAKIPYPSEQADPWFDQFLDMVNALDAAVYAGREDRNLLIMGGGLISWNATTQVLTWGDSIEFPAAPVGFVYRVVAANIVVVDGAFIYFQAVRSPTNNANVVLETGTQVPGTGSEDPGNSILFGIRRGSRIYFRNGLVIQDGELLNLFEIGGGGGGGGGALPLGTEGQVLTRTPGGLADYNAPGSSVEIGDSTWFLNSNVSGFSTLYEGGVTRVDTTTLKITERVVLGATVDGVLALGLVSDGTRLWVLWTQSDFSTYGNMSLSEVLIAAPGSSSFGAPSIIVALGPGVTALPSGIVFDAVNSKIWVSYTHSVDAANVIGVAASSLIAGTPFQVDAVLACSNMVLDTVVSHYGDSEQRLYFSFSSSDLVRRVTGLGGALAVDGADIVLSGVPTKAVLLGIGGGSTAVGGGRLYAASWYPPLIEVFDVAGVAGPTYAPPNVTYALSYAAAGDSLLIAEQSGGNFLIRKIDAALMTSTASLLLPPGDNSTGTVQPFFHFAIGPQYFWPTSPSLDTWSTAIPLSGGAFRVDHLGMTPAVALVTASGVAFQFPDRISWRPDGTGDVATWDEVMAVIGQRNTPVTICVDIPGLHVVEPGPGPNVIHDMKHARFEALEGPHDVLQVQIRRGATLLDLAGISGGMILQHNHVIGDGAVLAFSPGITPVFKVEKGAAIKGLPNAEIPMIAVTNANPEFYLVFNELGTAHYLPGTISPSTVDVGFGGILAIIVATGGLGVDAPQDSSWISSDVSSTIRWVHDGTMSFGQGAFPYSFWSQHPFVLGLQLNEPLGLVGGAGPSQFLPVYQGGGDPSIGCQYFNTDMDDWIWWTGTYLGWITVGGPLVRHAAALAVNTNDWNPTVTPLSGAFWPQIDVLYISSTINLDLTGILPPNVLYGAVKGWRKTLINEGANIITLKHDVTSTAANRFWIAGGDLALPSDASVDLLYDDVISRWRVV